MRRGRAGSDVGGVLLLRSVCSRWMTQKVSAGFFSPAWSSSAWTQKERGSYETGGTTRYRGRIHILEVVEVVLVLYTR